MIFKIDPEFIGKCAQPILSDIVCAAAKNGHYFIVGKNSRNILRTAVNTHASTTQKELVKGHNSMFDVTENLKEYLRIVIIDTDYSPKAFLYLVSGKARLVIENANHEWPLYKHIIDLYSSDPIWGDYFKLLCRAKNHRCIIGTHAGGTGELIKVANFDGFSYRSENLKLQKTCILFDRDTDDCSHFDPLKKPLFNFLVSSDPDKVTHDMIYTLNNGISWHMWYKRAIENYIPKEKYVQIGCDISQLSTLTPEQIDYLKIDNKSVPKYDKKRLPDLIKHLSRSDIEKGLKSFYVNGKLISEMQLFLLKLVRII